MRGFVTVFTYGSVGGFDIYPTQTEIAYGTSFERTEMHAEISVSNFNGGGRVTSVTVQPLEKKK